MSIRELLANTATMLVMCGAFATTGCGGGGPAPVKTDMVNGVVTLDGNPVAGAIVTFVPAQDGVGASATGKTDEQGSYTLTAVGAGGGAEIGAGTLPGEYHVGVVKDEIANLASLDDANRQEGKPSNPEIEVTHVVPQRYNDPLKSELKVNVTAGENNIPLELKSK